MPVIINIRTLSLVARHYALDIEPKADFVKAIYVWSLPQEHGVSISFSTRSLSLSLSMIFSFSLRFHSFQIVFRLKFDEHINLSFCSSLLVDFTWGGQQI